MSLQTHTFFFDTTHATPQGKGSWRFQLQEPLEVKGNQVVHCDDITFRNSFPTVDVFSNKLYLLTKYDDANYLKPDLSGAWTCLLYTSPSPRDATLSRMPSSA